MAIINTCFESFTKLSHRRINVLGIGSVIVWKHLSTKVEEHNVIDEIFPDVEGSPVNLPKDYFKHQKNNRYKKLNNSNEKVEGKVERDEHVVITCKNKKLNHYINQKYDKFEAIPLASKGWSHRLLKGDFFKINIFPDKNKRESVFWPSDIESFEGLGLENDIVEALKKLGFTRPTYIQAAGIPNVLQYQNTLLAGETGCGKTLAYLLPVIQEIRHWRSATPERKLNNPLALVLAPGRELAIQIGDVAHKLTNELQFDLEVIVGGHTKRLMTHPRFASVDLLVATTGVASKLTTSGVYNMSSVRHIVLDEADTILDDSFNSLIVRYLKNFPISYGKVPAHPGMLPEYCQLTLASATMPTNIPAILGGIIAPESLVTTETPRLHQVLASVPQMFLRLGQSQKPSKLLELVKKNMAKEIPTIVFCNRSKTCDWASMFLNESGISCLNINGDMPVDIRAGRFDQFQRGFVDVISCTDVVARGLDTIRAKHIINYEFPIYMADYIHRCGRVGRVGHTDDCLITNFVSAEMEIRLVQKVETAVRTMSVLPNVNANITRVIHHNIMKNESIF